MEDRELPLMGRIDAPSAVPAFYVRRCRSYRDAVRMGWALKRVHNMTHMQLAAELGRPPQHVSDYLAKDDLPRRRNLPPEAIRIFDFAVGNTCVSQWISWRSTLTVLEEMQATQAAAA